MRSLVSPSVAPRAVHPPGDEPPSFVFHFHTRLNLVMGSSAHFEDIYQPASRAHCRGHAVRSYLEV